MSRAGQAAAAASSPKYAARCRWLDPAVARLVAPQIRAFRQLVAERARRPRGRFRDPEAVGLVVAAAPDGLMLHALADPDTDVARAFAGLRALLRR